MPAAAAQRLLEAIPTWPLVVLVIGGSVGPAPVGNHLVGAGALTSLYGRG